MGGHPLDVSRGLLSNALQPFRAQAALDRLAELAAEWLRVGFCQGNFNADNCLVGGRTMDYGPFGFMDKYDPSFAKWVLARAGKESEIPNFQGSYLGRFPLVSADFWASDHLSERSRSVDAFSGMRARGTLTLKRR